LGEQGPAGTPTNRDTEEQGQRRTGAPTNRDREEQGQRRTGTEKNRDTDEQGQRRTGVPTNRDREEQGHRRTGTPKGREGIGERGEDEIERSRSIRLGSLLCSVIPWDVGLPIWKSWTIGENYSPSFELRRIFKEEGSCWEQRRLEHVTDAKIFWEFDDLIQFLKAD
jgi:hypothetical protein